MLLLNFPSPSLPLLRDRRLFFTPETGFWAGELLKKGRGERGEGRAKMAKKIRVALFFGGRSAEHEVSMQSAATVFKELDKRKFDVVPIYIRRDGKWTLQN
ncbi:MAG: hypothetical protein ABIG11_06920, partial [bacterium]